MVMTGTTRRKFAWFLLIACFALAFASTPVGAAPSVAQMLNFSPRQKGVVYSTPSTEEQEKCKVELIKGSTKGSGWLLRDPAGQPLRIFFDTNADNKIDVWSYFKDGSEVYREIDTTFTGRPDQYRWLNAGGMKWGVDDAKDGTIKSWKAISAEEVSQELLQALVAHDFARFEALLITDSEIKKLELPAEQAAKLQEQHKNAASKFQDAIAKLTSLSPKATWVHLETMAPQCLPADQTGARYDLIKHSGGTILFEVAGKNDWIQTGEIIQVGSAWRLTDAPVPGPSPIADITAGSTATKDPEVVKLIDDLTTLDKSASSTAEGAALAAHHLKRADLLEKLAAKVKNDEREPWLRQIGDSLSTAAQSSGRSDTTAMARLLKLEQSVSEAAPGSALAGYITFREMQADYSAKSSNTKDFNKIQADWVERLTKFVQTYPKAEDTPDALLQLGMVNEFLGKDIEAKNWYAKLAKDFGEKPQALKAAGARRRLDLEGQPLKLAGPLLNDPASSYDVDMLGGKVVVVYYWASWNTQGIRDFAGLGALLKAHGKDVALVGVNMDMKMDEAKSYLDKNNLPGTHIYGAGGLDGKLANDYGVMTLPHLFLVGKDGKVVNRNAQIEGLEEEIKKLLK